MDTRYTLFLQNKIIGEYENHTQMRDEYEGFFPVGSFLFSSSMREWYNYQGMLVTNKSEIPPYIQHLQLVLGL